MEDAKRSGAHLDTSPITSMQRSVPSATPAVRPAEDVPSAAPPKARRRGRPPKSTSTSRAPATASVPPPPATRVIASDTPPPMVFQCFQCLSIVGDSTSWIMAQRQLGFIVLRDVTDKVVALEFHTMSDDIGWERYKFAPLACAHCDQVLGRMYKDTPPEWSTLRAAYCLSHSALLVYQLGSTRSSQSGSDIDFGGLSAHDGDDDKVSRSPSPHIPSKLPPIVSVNASAEAEHDKDLGKIRTLLMAMGERLLRLEQQIPSLQASSQAPLIPSMNDRVTHRATPSSWDGITRSPSFHGPVQPGRSFLLDDLSSRRLPPLAPVDDARWISTPHQHRSPTSTDALSRAPSVWARHASTGL